MSDDPEDPEDPDGTAGRVADDPIDGLTTNGDSPPDRHREAGIRAAGSNGDGGVDGDGDGDGDADGDRRNHGTPAGLSGALGNREGEDPPWSFEGEDPPWSFEEVQRFRQAWLWGAILLVSALAVLTVLARRPGPVLSAVLLLVPAVGIPGTYFARLRTEVTREGLVVQLWPLHRTSRRVPFEDVTEVEAVEFRPFRDYGGIGIRRTPGGWAYIVAGTEGVLLHRGDEEATLLVGSRRPGELERAVAAGVARARAEVEGDDQPRWQAVANFDADDLPGEVPDGDAGAGTGAGASDEPDPDG